MCGIFACISKFGWTVATHDVLNEALNQIQSRGPDDTSKYIDDRVYLGFHRLMINDLSDHGKQPFHSDDGDTHIMCNGEIFNYKELTSRHDIVLKSHSDCEIILELYRMHKKTSGAFESACRVANELDGEFACIIYDGDNLIAFRDPYGVRPLFYGLDDNDRMFFASEAKSLVGLCSFVEQFKPGHIMHIDVEEKCITKYIQYSNELSKLTTFSTSLPTSFFENCIRELVISAVKKRMMSDVPICALLSGGLDSSLVAAILAAELKKTTDEPLHTFSIGLVGSSDTVYAEKAALHIGSKHTSVICTDQEFLDAIPEVIWAIESYDVTTVRASIGNYLVGKFIAKNTDFRVVFNGDYADEVMGGYLYFHNAPSALEFHKETIRLVTDIHYFDSLRSDRTISCHGLEARAPYSDKAFVDFYMRIPHELRMPSKTGVEKNLIRNAFSCIRADILPSSILNRRKEAFSDGVSNANTSWHEILQKYADTKISDEYFVSEKKKFEHNAPLTKEALIYRQIFELHFHTHEHMIPYGWMPKWVGNVSDPSARVLSMY